MTLEEDLLPLRDLAARLARAAEALPRGGPLLTRPRSQGAGDVSYGVDLACEEVLEAWFLEQARQAPLSLLSEHHGWRHAGPGPAGSAQFLADFDHGGPTYIVDPVDGTRPFLARQRSAFVLIARTDLVHEAPRLSQVKSAVLRELPVRGPAREFLARAGRGAFCLDEGRTFRLRVDGEAHLDHAYFTFFAFTPKERLQVARLAHAVSQGWGELGADPEAQWSDDCLSSSGLLVQMAQGDQRLLADLRGLLGPSFTSCHGYDLAAPVLLVREAGAVVTGPRGEPFDPVLDATTPLSFLAWCNEETRARGREALERALAAWPGDHP